MRLEAADLARWTLVCSQGWDWEVRGLDDLMFVELCFCLFLSASFAPSFEQGDEIIIQFLSGAYFHVYGFENSPLTSSCVELLQGRGRFDSLVWTSRFSGTSRNPL